MAKKKTQKIRYYVLHNGEKYQVLAEDGKYYICEGTQFRKKSEQGKLVVETVDISQGTGE